MKYWNKQATARVFPFCRDLTHDNITCENCRYINIVISHIRLVLFSIDSNELIVKKSGIYEIRLFGSYKSNRSNTSVRLRSTNTIDGVITNKKVTNVNHTTTGSNTLWLPITIFFVTQLTCTADTQRHTIIMKNGELDGQSYSNFFVQKIK